MNIPIDLSAELSPKTLKTVLRWANDFALDPTSSGSLCWLVQLLKHIKDTSYNFPTGKYHTLEVLQRIIDANASKVVSIYYGASNGTNS